MSVDDTDSRAVDKDIKNKLNLHLKKRIKQTITTTKRKCEPCPEDDPEFDPEDGAVRKPTGKTKAKKPKAEEEEQSDKEVEPSQKTVPVLNILQFLLNEKKRSLMRDSQVIEMIRKKQGRIP